MQFQFGKIRFRTQKIRRIRHALLRWAGVKTFTAKVPMFNWRLRLPVHSYVSRAIYRHGNWELENTQFLQKNIRLKKGDAAIDVGANIGWYSLALDNIADNSGARVFAFEPDRKNFLLLTENLRHNGANSVTAIQKGLSDKAELKTMHLNKDDSGSHSMLHLAGQDRTETVQTVTLNSFLKENKINPRAIRFCKMDIEGFELLALRGATAMLDTCPLIMLEYAPKLMTQGNINPQDLISLMAAHHYRAHYLIREQLHPAREASLYVDSPIDIFWCKK